MPYPMYHFVEETKRDLGSGLDVYGGSRTVCSGLPSNACIPVKTRLVTCDRDRRVQQLFGVSALCLFGFLD